MASPQYDIGDFVWIDPVAPATEVRRGICRFTGETKFAEGPWVGIELVGSPGKNSGSVFDIQYFQCLPQQGVFVRPELVRPFTAASPTPNVALGSSSIPSKQTSTFDLQLRVELEELREKVASMAKTLDENAVEIEELKLDKEISEEQRLAAETELEELKISAGAGAPTASTIEGSLAEVVVALKHDKKRLEKTLHELRVEKEELEEQVRATDVSDSVLESLTNRNLELDEALTDTKRILAATLKEKDDLQEVLSMQDEEIRFQKQDIEALTAALEDAKSQHDVQLAQLQSQLDREKHATSALEQKLFDIEQHIGVTTAAVESSHDADAVGLAIASSSLQALRSEKQPKAVIGSVYGCLTDNNNAASMSSPQLCDAYRSIGMDSDVVAQLWICGVAEGIACAHACVRDTLVAPLLRCVAFLSANVHSSTAAAPCQKHLHAIALHDAAIAAEAIRLDLLVMVEHVSISDWRGTATAQEKEDIAAIVRSVGTVCIRDILDASLLEDPACSLKNLKRPLIEFAKVVKGLRQRLVSMSILSENGSSGPLIRHASDDALVALTASARMTLSIAERLPSSMDFQKVKALLKPMLQPQQPTVLQGCEIVECLVLAHVAFASVVCRSLAFSRIQEVLQLAIPATDNDRTDGSSGIQSLIASLLFDGQGAAHVYFASRNMATGKHLIDTTLRVFGKAVIPAYLHDGTNDGSIDAEEGDKLWSACQEVALRLVNVSTGVETPGHEDRSIRRSFVDVFQEALCVVQRSEVAPAAAGESHDAHVNTAAASVGGGALYELQSKITQLQDEKTQLEAALEQSKWSLWQATSENEALVLVKADFKRIQDHVDTQEAEHQASIRALSQEYDGAIHVLQQKNMKMTQELREAKRQELQRELSPMSLQERCEFQHALLFMQSHLALAYGNNLRRPTFVADWQPRGAVKTSTVAAVDNAPPLPPQKFSRVLRFTSKSERQRSREAVFIPALKHHS